MDFQDAATHGTVLATIKDVHDTPHHTIPCAACNTNLVHHLLALAPQHAKNTNNTHTHNLYCHKCLPHNLGPPCRKCNQPAPRKNAVLAADSWWHRDCFNCAACGVGLGDEYHVHEGALLCAEHYLRRTARTCARCDQYVSGGVSALGKLWHDECLVCAHSGALIGRGQFYLVDGEPVAAAAFRTRAPACGECGEPAVADRLFALGRFHHRRCFVCVHCGEEIGAHRFVEHDGEPYLEGCYRALFGAVAPAEVQAAVRARQLRQAAVVPLSRDKLGGGGASGRGGLASLLERHEQLLPDVRRALRPQGVTQLQSFYLGAQPTRPALCLSMLVPDTTDVKEMICDAARTDRSVREWEQLLSAVYDAGAVRNAAWYELFEHELNADEVLRISSGE